MFFATDDMENLHKFWSAGWMKTIEGNLFLWEPFSRAMAGFFYLPLYSLFGLNPLPYRIVCFLLLGANVYLLFRVTRALAGTDEPAYLAALIGSFHGALYVLYYSTSTIFDVLCYFFYFAAWLWYLQRAPCLGWRLIPFLGLFVCALNSKEMAVTLPVLLVITEAHRRDWRLLAAPMIAGILTAVFIWGKTHGEGSAVIYENYQPVFTAQNYVSSTLAYLNMLVYADGYLNAFRAGLVVAALVAAAWFLRSRLVATGLLLGILGMLPLNFVPVRDAYALAIPFAGFAMALGGLIYECRKRFAPRMSAAALLVVLALVLGAEHRYQANRKLPFLKSSQEWGHDMVRKASVVQWPRGGCVLVAGHPYKDDWLPYFILKLVTNDHNLGVRVDLPDGTDRGDICKDRVRVWRYGSNRVAE